MCHCICVCVCVECVISLCVWIEAFLWAWGDVLQLPLFLHFDVLVGMHLTGILKVGPVCWENHEEVDLEEKGEVDGRWACQRCKASYRSQSYSTYITDIHKRKVKLFLKKKRLNTQEITVTIMTNTVVTILLCTLLQKLHLKSMRMSREREQEVIHASCNLLEVSAKREILHFWKSDPVPCAFQY